MYSYLLKARNFLFLLPATLKGVPSVAAKLAGIVSSSILNEHAPARARLDSWKLERQLKYT